MARNIQSGGGSRASAKTFAGLLGSALFWLVVAVVFPVALIPKLAPALAPYAQWAPTVFYALAIWSFARFVRGLLGLAASRRGSAIAGSRPRARGADRSARRDGAKSADHAMPAIDRKPTVQRMR